MKPSPIIKLTNAQVGAILAHIPMLEAFIKAIKLEAMRIMMHDPSSMPDFKVVEGKSRRHWKDEEAIIKELSKHFDIDAFAPRSLAGLTEVSKLLPVKKRDAWISKNTVKPHGKPTIVGTSDPRRAINGNALLDFAADIEDVE